MSLIPTTSAVLSEDEIDTLRFIAGRMIPASEEYGVPGADDPAIVRDMTASVGRDGSELKHALNLVRDARVRIAAGLAEQRDLIEGLKRQSPAQFAVLESLVLRTYYRDDRVLRSIGMEARPPFPKGYDLAEGDFALLETVRARGIIYRGTDN